MIPKIIEAQYAQEFTVHVRFSDGTEGDVIGIVDDLPEDLRSRELQPRVRKELEEIVFPGKMG